MKILVIGPSLNKSKGGMATMMSEMKKSRVLENENLDFYSSYIDGCFIIRLVYCVFSFVRFIFIKKNYDIFHIHSASYGSFFRKKRYIDYLKKRNKKIIIHIHGAEFLVFFNKLSKNNKEKVIQTLKKTDVVVALSDGWKFEFEKNFGLTNCVSIPNGINVNLYENCKCDAVKNRKSFISLGRLGERKGTYLLIEAVKKILPECPNIKLFLAGDGEIEKVKEIIKINNLLDNIFVLGWIDIEKKKEYLSKSSTLILPSYNEGLPMAILEAMASSKIIISTDVGAISNIVSEDNGFLIKAGDLDSLSNSIKLIYNNECDCQQKSENSFNLVSSKYDIMIIHKKISDLYKKVYEE